MVLAGSHREECLPSVLLAWHHTDRVVTEMNWPPSDFPTHTHTGPCAAGPPLQLEGTTGHAPLSVRDWMSVICTGPRLEGTY